MHFFKLALSFLAIGGATYALIKIEKAPAWLVAASILMALATLITALPQLPGAIDGLVNAIKKLDEMIRPQRPEGEYEPGSSAKTTFMYAPFPTRCAALVMSPDGAWGASFGSGLDCSTRLERARSLCADNADGWCDSYATGLWVAGIYCRVRAPYRIRRYSFVGDGTSESEAFAHAFEQAADRGFYPHVCRHRVAVSADAKAPRRYD
jgi:hypothetical protein